MSIITQITQKHSLISPWPNHLHPNLSPSPNYLHPNLSSSPNHLHTNLSPSPDHFHPNLSPSPNHLHPNLSPQMIYILISLHPKSLTLFSLPLFLSPSKSLHTDLSLSPLSSNNRMTLSFTHISLSLPVETNKKQETKIKKQKRYLKMNPQTRPPGLASWKKSKNTNTHIFNQSSNQNNTFKST